jgi:hypothetical protein
MALEVNWRSGEISRASVEAKFCQPASQNGMACMKLGQLQIDQNWRSERVC